MLAVRAPLFEPHALVLNCVGELVREDGLLLVGLDPVEHVDGLGFVVVVAGDLLGEQADEEGAQVEVAVQQAELLQDDFRSLQPLGALVFFEALLQVLAYFVACDQPALDVRHAGQGGIGRGEGHDLVDGLE